MKKSILIVEDDPFTQQFYQFLFSKIGFNVIQTENGDEIINILDEKEIGIIILDINLKNTYVNNIKVDGVMISKMIKKETHHSNIPILLVTAYQKKLGERNYMDDSYAEDYIIKPITDYNELIKKVNRLILK